MCWNGVEADGQWKFARFDFFDEGLRAFISADFVNQFLQLLLNGLVWKGDPVDNIGDGQVSTNQLQIILNGAFTKQTLKDTSNEINHHSVVLLLQNLRKLGEDDHPVVPHAQL